MDSALLYEQGSLIGNRTIFHFFGIAIDSILCLHVFGDNTTLPFKSIHNCLCVYLGTIRINQVTGLSVIQGIHRTELVDLIEGIDGIGLFALLPSLLLLSGLGTQNVLQPFQSTLYIGDTRGDKVPSGEVRAIHISPCNWASHSTSLFQTILGHVFAFAHGRLSIRISPAPLIGDC